MSLLWSAFRRVAFWPSCAALLLFIAFFYWPESWMASTAWHLYLDRLHPLFTMPASLSARAWMGGAAAIFLFLLLCFFALLIPRRRSVPRLSSHAEATSAWGMSIVDQAVLDDLIAQQGNGRVDGAAAPDSAVDRASDVSGAERPHGDTPPRNRWDRHPDDAPRAPISAERELPAGGLDGTRTDDAAQTSGADAALAFSGASWDALLSDDLPADDAPLMPKAPQAEQIPPTAPSEPDPWLQSVDQAGPAAPAADDVSLSALVARLEARLARRRRPIAPLVADGPAMPAPKPPPMTVADHQIDLALEAALGTLQRMNLRAVG